MVGGSPAGMDRPYGPVRVRSGDMAGVGLTVTDDHYEIP